MSTDESLCFSCVLYVWGYSMRHGVKGLISSKWTEWGGLLMTFSFNLFFALEVLSHWSPILLSIWLYNTERFLCSLYHLDFWNGPDFNNFMTQTMATISVSQLCCRTFVYLLVSCMCTYVLFKKKTLETRLLVYMTFKESAYCRPGLQSVGKIVVSVKS